MDLSSDIVDLARRREPERYLSALLAPEPARTALVTLAAFAAELRRIPDAVKEPMMGEVRLQWWRDVIATFVRSEPLGHPLADGLAIVVREHRLPLASLLAMTEARAFDLYHDPMPDAAALDGYLTKTEGLTFDCAARVLGRDMPVETTTAAAHCFGLSRLLLTSRRWSLPTVDLAQRVSGLRAAYDSVRRDTRGDRLLRLAALPVATVPSYIAAIERNERRSEPARTDIDPFARVLRIARARWLGL